MRRATPRHSSASSRPRASEVSSSRRNTAAQVASCRTRPSFWNRSMPAAATPSRSMISSTSPSSCRGSPPTRSGGRSFPIWPRASCGCRASPSRSRTRDPTSRGSRPSRNDRATAIGSGATRSSFPGSSRATSCCSSPARRPARPSVRAQPGHQVPPGEYARARCSRGPRAMTSGPPVRGRRGFEGGRRACEYREIPRVGMLLARGERRDGRPRRVRDGAGHAHRTEDAGDEVVPDRARLKQSRPRAHRASRPRPPEVVLRDGVRTMRRRSQLYVPANNPRMIAKAAGLEADSILFDLEDAVPTDEKEAARQSLGSALRKAGWGRRELGVRINAPRTPEGERDLAALAGEPLVTVLVVPKAESDLSSLGRATGKALIPIIETARGVMRVEDVVRSEGVVAVTYGAGDLATSVGGDAEAYGRNVYVKTLLVIAAAAYGLERIDRGFFDPQ